MSFAKVKGDFGVFDDAQNQTHEVTRMAAGSSTPVAPGSPTGIKDRRPEGDLVEFDRYIEQQLHRTRRQVKGVDLSSSLMTLALGGLVYLMAVALVDHWVVPGGLGFAGRLMALIVLALGATAFTIVRLAPLALRRINPVYAAHTIERGRPGIKNSLINFLLLRSEPNGLPSQVYQAMETQAVNALTSVHPEATVDRTPIIRLLLGLLVFIAGLGLYGVLSPKNPFTSFRRVMAPWSSIAAPTRVAIRDVQPGETTAFHDQHLQVSAEISGIGADEAVTLVYSSLDGQVVRRGVPMSVPEAAYRHQAELPGEAAGLQQDLEYWIEAGDAVSEHYRVKVETSPAINVETVEYEYPAYAEMERRQTEHRGDIQALEGTRVTLHATANQAIKHADIDFECDGRNDLPMKVEGREATASFTLVWNERNKQPDHVSYQLRFANPDGHENPEPVRYSIDVVRDLPPEISIVEPKLDPAEEITLPLGAPLRLSIKASDPDFKLGRVQVHARRGGTKLAEKSLLAEPRAGELTLDYLLDTKRLELRPGEKVEFWASADDNKQPEANHAETPHYTLVIASPDDKRQPQADQPDPKNQPDQQNEDGQQGDKGQPSDNGQGGKGDKGNADKQGDDGEEGQPGAKGRRNDKGRDDQKGEGEESGGAKGQRGKQRGGKHRDGRQQPDDQKSDGANEGHANEGHEGGQEGDGQGESRQDGEKSAGDERSGHRQPANGENRGANDAEGSQQKNEAADGEGSNGEQQPDPADGQAGAGKTGNDEQRVDPERDAGQAIDKINEFFNQNKPEQNDAEKKPSEQQQRDASENETREQPSPDKNKKDTGDQPGGQGEQASQPGQKQQPGDEQQPGGKQQMADQAGDKSPTGDQGKPGDQAGENGQEGGKGNQAQNSPGGKGQRGGQPRSGDQANNRTGKNKQPGENDAQSASRKDGADDSDEANQAHGKPKAKQPNQGGKSGKQSSTGQRQPDGAGEVNNEGAERKPADRESGDTADERPQGSDESAKHADGQTRPKPGEGDQSKGFGDPNEKDKPDENAARQPKGGDSQSADKGDPGAGLQANNDNGAPSPDGGRQTKEKQQTNGKQKPSNHDDDPTTFSTDNNRKQSDSKGGQAGDLEGGGKTGGGQASESEGVGSPGQNTGAQQGAGQAPEKGKGPTGDKGGDQAEGDDATTPGKSSGKKGAGSHQRPGESESGGKKSPGAPQPDKQAQNAPEGSDGRGHSNDGPRQPNANQQAKPGRTDDQPQNQRKGGQEPAERADGDNKQPQTPGGQPSPADRGGNKIEQGPKGSGSQTNPTGGGLPDTNQTTAPQSPDLSEPGGDAANLEYAKKATDLAIDRLSDQLAKGQVDPALLEKLQWTEEDADKFVKQWEKLRRSARETGARGNAAREELDEALRSLGLRPKGTKLRGDTKPNDRGRDLHEGLRTTPPADYLDQVREFKKSTSRKSTGR